MQKLGQFVSSRVDLLPEPYVTALSRLQDRAPALPRELIAACIGAGLGAFPDEIFAARRTAYAIAAKKRR